MHESDIEMDHLALGLTKPPTKLGIPMTALYLSILLCLMGWMVYQVVTADTGITSILIFVAVWLVSYASLFYLTFNDPFGLNIFWLNCSVFRRHVSHSFWSNTDTFAP